MVSAPEKAKKKRKKRTYSVGESTKLKDVYTIHPKAIERYPCTNGQVIFNPAKFILRPLTDEEIDMLIDSGKNKKFKGRRAADEYGNWWKCYLHDSCRFPKHPEFVKVGSATANLKRHCDRWHEAVLGAIVRMVAELPMNEVEGKIIEYVQGVPLPVGDMDSFFRRLSRQEHEVHQVRDVARFAEIFTHDNFLRSKSHVSFGISMRKSLFPSWTIRSSRTFWNRCK